MTTFEIDTSFEAIRHVVYHYEVNKGSDELILV